MIDLMKILNIKEEDCKYAVIKTKDLSGNPEKREYHYNPLNDFARAKEAEYDNDEDYFDECTAYLYYNYFAWDMSAKDFLEGNFFDIDDEDDLELLFEDSYDKDQYEDVYDFLMNNKL